MTTKRIIDFIFTAVILLVLIPIVGIALILLWDSFFDTLRGVF